MAHTLEPTAESIPDIGIAPYRLSARMRKTLDDPVSSVKRVGQELRDERKRKGQQLDDVWRALKIRSNYLAAIEEGRFDDLPGRAFTIGYVGRYARYLRLDVEKLLERLEAEIAAHDGISHHRIDIEPLSDRKFPFLGIAIAGLLLAALIYSRDDVVSFATRTFEQVTEEGFAQKLVDALVPPPIEQQTQVAAPESTIPLPFEVAATQPVSLRPEFLPPIPVIAVTQEVSVRPELLPPLPVIAVTQEVSVRPEFLPPLPVIAVTQQVSVRPELLPPLPVIAVTQAVSVRPELLPPLPVIAVTQAVSVRPEFLPPLPVITVTQPLSVRPEFLPPIPVIAVTRPVSLRADLAPAAIQQQARVAPLFLPMPIATRVSVTPPVSLRAELLPQRVQAQLPPGRRYGLQNSNSRITLRVHRPTIVAIRDARNRVFIDRNLAPGDTYRVPNLAGLWLTAIDASAVEIVLDGASVGFAGAQGTAARDLSLNPQGIADRARRAGSQAGSAPSR